MGKWVFTPRAEGRQVTEKVPVCAADHSPGPRRERARCPPGHLLAAEAEACWELQGAGAPHRQAATHLSHVHSSSLLRLGFPLTPISGSRESDLYLPGPASGSQLPPGWLVSHVAGWASRRAQGQSLQLATGESQAKLTLPRKHLQRHTHARFASGMTSASSVTDH